MTLSHPADGGKSRCVPGGDAPADPPTPAEIAQASKSLGQVVERRLLALFDYDAAKQSLHKAQVAGDPALIAGARLQLDLAAGADAGARRDTADVFMLLLRDAAREYPDAFEARLLTAMPRLLARLDRIESRVAELEAVVAAEVIR